MFLTGDKAIYTCPGVKSCWVKFNTKQSIDGLLPLWMVIANANIKRNYI